MISTFSRVARVSCSNARAMNLSSSASTATVDVSTVGGLGCISTCVKLSFLGGGKMAESIIGALKSKNLLPMQNVHVYDVNEDRLAYLQSKFDIQITSSASDAVSNAEIVILAVKPQHVATVAESINKPIDSLMLSIVAGCTMTQLKNSFKTNYLIRSMPNTPAMVLEGITVWCATEEIPMHLVEKAKGLIESFGEQVQVKDESYLDMATAVSGSGPAYVFLVMESMIEAAVHIGFPREVATKLVQQTIKGSVVYSQQSNKNLSTLRHDVTSPGGTTASALYSLERGGFRTVIADGIWSAYRRALELGGNAHDVGPRPR